MKLHPENDKPHFLRPSHWFQALKHLFCLGENAHVSSPHIHMIREVDWSQSEWSHPLLRSYIQMTQSSRQSLASHESVALWVCCVKYLHTLTRQLFSDESQTCWTSLSSSLFSFVTQLFMSLFMWTTECNTLNVVHERRCKNACLYSHTCNVITSASLLWLFTPAFECGRSE